MIDVQTPDISFYKSRDVKTPSRGTEDAAGTDFFIPNYSLDFLYDLQEKNKHNVLSYRIVRAEDAKVEGYPVPDGVSDDQEFLLITIPAGEQVNIPSGIKVIIGDVNTYLEANNKSGVATKYHLLNGASVVDYDYRGEIHLNMMNVGNTDVTLISGQKITQFIHKVYVHTNWIEIDQTAFEGNSETARGDNAFGSTGNV